MNIGSRIKAAREAAKMTQEELGAACGTTKQSIFKYETGIVTNIPLDRIEKIAGILGVSPAYLMGWEEIKNEPTPVSEDGLDKEAKEVADAYMNADNYVRFGVRRLLGLEVQNEYIQLAARKSDKPHAVTGPDTDVEI